MLDYLIDNWLWILLVTAFSILHLRMHRGHGGHGGRGRRGWPRRRLRHHGGDTRSHVGP